MLTQLRVAPKNQAWAVRCIGLGATRSPETDLLGREMGGKEFLLFDNCRLMVVR
jgi:hypothetical protein